MKQLNDEMDAIKLEKQRCHLFRLKRANACLRLGKRL
jgi:hypothetical protein